PQGEDVDVAIRWDVDGARVEVEGGSLPAVHTRKGQTVRCVGTPSSGERVGASVTSATVTVGNTPPTVAMVVVTPAAPRAGEPLRCEASEARDADGDPVTLATQWVVD